GGRGPQPVPDTGDHIGADDAGHVQGRDRTAVIATPVAVHEIRRAHLTATPRTTHREAHAPYCAPGNGGRLPRSAVGRGWLGVLPDPRVHGDPAGHPGVD